MDKKLFVVVADTTETNLIKPGSPVKRGVLNAYVAYATDPANARQVILKMWTPEIAMQMKNSLYVYSVEDIGVNLKGIDEIGGHPFFSHLPINGARPPKQNMEINVSTSSGNTTLAPSVVPENKQVQPANQPKVAPVKKDPRIKPQIGRPAAKVRSEANEEQSRPVVSEDLPNDRAKQIIRALGVTKNDGQDEGVNNRVNAATGKNNNLTPPNVPQTVKNSMKPNQAQLLAGLGVPVPQDNQIDPDLDADVIDSRTSFEDPSLAEVDNHVLSEDEIKRMQKDLDDTK